MDVDPNYFTQGSKQNVVKLLVVLLSNQQGVLCTHKTEQPVAACWVFNITKSTF